MRRKPAPVGPPPFPAIHWIAVGLVFALLAILTCREVSSLDVGFHLKAGERILAGAGWPRNDTFTFTVNDHPYTDMSWGYQVLVALVQRASGPAGLVVFHAILVLALFSVLLLTARLVPVDPAWLVSLLTLGGLASEVRFEARPELASYLFLAVVLHLLHRRSAGRAVPMWLFPLLFLAWANTHSLFILGWGALACFLLGHLLAGKGFDRALALWGGASVAACLVNPYGWRGVAFPFTLATRMREGNPFAESIGEFVSPLFLPLSNQFPFYPKVPLWSFYLLLAVSVVSAVRLLQQRRIGPFLLWLAFTPLALQMIRNMPVMIVATLPGIIQTAPRIGRRYLRPAILVAACAAAALIGLRARSDAYYVASRRMDRFGFGWNRLVAPAGATEWASSTGLHGRPLNHLNFGGWLGWRLTEPVFIDGRLEVMGEEFYKDYLRALGSAEELEAAVRRYDLKWLIFPYGIAPELTNRVSHDTKWRLAYADSVACVFVRADAPAAPATIVPPDPGPPLPVPSLPGLGGAPRRGGLSHWLAGLAARQAFPEESYNLGLFHLFRGELPEAERRFDDALVESGGSYYEIYSNLAAVLWRQGRKDEARSCYRVVLEDDPSNRIARARLGG